MISKAISKANAREAEGRHVTVQTSIEVFLSKCLTLKDSLRSKMQNEILMTSNFISRTLIKQEPAECLPEIGDHIEAMCAEVNIIITGVALIAVFIVESILFEVYRFSAVIFAQFFCRFSMMH